MKEIIIHEGKLFDYLETVEVPEPDTSLHIMGGPPTQTPKWIIESWKRAADARKESSPSQPDSQ